MQPMTNSLIVRDATFHLSAGPPYFFIENAIDTPTCRSTMPILEVVLCSEQGAHTCMTHNELKERHNEVGKVDDIPRRMVDPFGRLEVAAVVHKNHQHHVEAADSIQALQTFAWRLRRHFLL